jgi:hypothetical protein
LARVRGHARAPTKSRKSGAYDSDGVCYRSCARGSSVSCSSEGIRRGVCDLLRAGIRCATTLISSLLATVLQSGAASLDSFKDPAYGGLRDSVRGLHWD